MKFQWHQPNDDDVDFVMELLDLTLVKELNSLKEPSNLRKSEGASIGLCPFESFLTQFFLMFKGGPSSIPGRRYRLHRRYGSYSTKNGRRIDNGSSKSMRWIGRFAKLHLSSPVAESEMLRNCFGVKFCI